MATKMMQKFLLVECMVAMVNAAVWDPDMFSPILPLPFHQRNGSTTLIVDTGLKFTLQSESKVLRSAISRYQNIIFAWGPASYIPATVMIDNPVLSEVTVAVDNHDDTHATLQLGMDESYSLVVPATPIGAINNTGTVYEIE